MNTLVVYDSQFGNTEQIARNIADTCSGFGTANAVRVNPDISLPLNGIDVLIVGCPTQAFRQTPAMRAFLENLPTETLSHLSIACFDTRVHMPWPLNGSAAQSMAHLLRRKGVHLLVPPQGFFVQSVNGNQGARMVEGEMERATSWAVDVYEKYAAAHPQAAMR